MAVQFPDLNAAYYDNANWMDNVDSMSWSGWVSWDTIDVGSTQYIWGHRGAVDRAHFRKNNAATEYARWSVTAGGVFATVDDTITPVAGTAYHFVLTWEKNSATGMKLYRNGALIATSSTTSQTANYNSGGNVDLYLGCLSNNNSFGECTGEGWTWWPGVVLDADQAARLYYEGWPHLAQCPKPAALYELNGCSLTRLQDSSGNSRHITSGFIDSGVVDGGRIGKWEDPVPLSAGFYRQGAAGPSPPNAWTLFSTVTHPTNTETVTSLSNGTTYEFKVNAVDTGGSESVDSAIVEATPYAVSSIHAEREVLLWHTPDLQPTTGVGRVHICGFETGTDNEIKRILRNAEISSTEKRTGAYSLRVYPDDTAGLTGVGYAMLMAVDEYGAEDSAFAIDTSRTRAYVYVESLPAADNEQMMRIEDSTTALKAELRIESDGTISLYDKDIALVTTGATALVPYGWYRLELEIGKGTTARYELRIDGVEEFSGYGNFLDTQTGTVILGKYNNRNQEAYEMFFDDCAVDKLNWPGAGAVHVLLPNADGNYTGWTASSGNKYDCIKEIPVLVTQAGGDTDYIYSTTLSDAYTAQYQSRADAGITGDVLCVKAIGFARKNTASSAPTISLRVRSGTTDLDTTPDILSQLEYEHWIRFLPTDPADGLAWTGAAVDALEVGFVHDTVNTYEERVTQVCLLVEERE